MPVQTQMQVRRGTASSWTSTNPTLAAGELGFETDTGKFKIGTGASTWTALPYAGGGAQATFTTYQYTATAAQTTFSGVDANGNTLAYIAGSVQVYLNGALLQDTADYAATNGTSVVLTTGALVGDSLTVIALGTFTVSTDIPKSTLTAKGSIVGATAASTPANLSVGANDTVLTADSSTATGLKWAAPVSGSITWTPRQGRQSNFSINQIAYNGTNLYVAVASGGGLFTSPDGITWTSRTSGFGSNAIFAVAFGNGAWVIGGANGTMATSTDGITWTSRTSGFGTNQIRAIVYGNALWVAVGANARITTSTDLATWTERSTSGAGTIYSVIYANSLYVAVGTFSTNNIFYSSNGTSWTGVAAGGDELVYVYYHSGQYVAYTNSGVNTGYYSTNGSSWTNFNTFSTSNALNLRGNQTHNGFYYALNYSPTGILPKRIFKQSAAIDTTAGYPQYYYEPIDLPNNYVGQEVSCIFINPSGGWVIADAQGRIWTSF